MSGASIVSFAIVAPMDHFNPALLEKECDAQFDLMSDDAECGGAEYSGIEVHGFTDVFATTEQIDKVIDAFKAYPWISPQAVSMTVLDTGGYFEGVVTL